jgi:magnesium chelatase subunit I
MRANLVRALREGRSLFPGLHGYQDTVIPQVENAVLAGHDILLLGERGQAKSRLARGLTSLLDEWIPIVAGSETHDDPFQPISAFGRAQVALHGDDTPVTWVHRNERYAEKLATPDTSIADLIGEVDPIKIAEGRYLSNEEIIAFGLIPRTNRGIFNMNELPDLSERIQVGLLNILEERDVQIRGFTVRLPLDVMVVASANPEDYTNRGRIITPLKDRFGSQIRTHYPASTAQELEIVEQEQSTQAIAGIELIVPRTTRELIATISHVARSHPNVNARSGVSVRMTISNYEALVANAQRRAILSGDQVAVPGIIDISALNASILGKIEFDTWEADDESRVVDDIIAESVRSVGHHLTDTPWAQELLAMVNAGRIFLVDPSLRASEMLAALALTADVVDGVKRSAGNLEPAAILAEILFALEYWYRVGHISKTAEGYTDI